MNNAKRLEIVRRLAALRPNPKSELDWRNPFELLIAVMLSAQTTDKKVNAVTPALFAVAPTPEAMAAKRPEDIEPLISSLGLFRNKAKNVCATAAALVEQHHCQVPQTFEELTALPGVGEKTAKVVLNVAFGQPWMAVDTHIFRVSNRTGLACGKTPSIVGAKLEKLLPKDLLVDGHHWILLHGRYCCTAQKPHCSECPIADLCEWKDKPTDD